MRLPSSENHHSHKKLQFHKTIHFPGQIYRSEQKPFKSYFIARPEQFVFMGTFIQKTLQTTYLAKQGLNWCYSRLDRITDQFRQCKNFTFGQKYFCQEWIHFGVMEQKILKFRGIWEKNTFQLIRRLTIKDFCNIFAIGVQHDIVGIHFQICVLTIRQPNRT